MHTAVQVCVENWYDTLLAIERHRVSIRISIKNRNRSSRMKFNFRAFLRPGRALHAHARDSRVALAAVQGAVSVAEARRAVEAAATIERPSNVPVEGICTGRAKHTSALQSRRASTL